MGGPTVRGVLVSGALGAGLIGCGDSSEDPMATDSVVVDASSRADSLVVLLSGRAAAEDSYLHSSHLRRVELWVDGQEWGACDASDSLASSATGDDGEWLLVEERSPTLFVAPLLEGDGAGEDLDSAGEWAALLERPLVAGGHVAELRRLTLSNGADEAVVESGLLVPFTVLDGFRSALVGDLDVAVDLGELP